MTLSPLSKFHRPPLPSQGIYYKDRRFSEPARFPSAPIPPLPGVYAILVRDTGLTPRPFRLLYIGESANLNERITKQHEKFEDWIREALGSHLYFAYHETIGMTDQQRRDVECELINHYNPPCNSRMSAFWSEVGKRYGQ
jgi:excinuclease UvrABC nuclease subunit